MKLKQDQTDKNRLVNRMIKNIIKNFITLSARKKL